MSYLLNSSSSVFSGILNNANNYGLSCQFRNLSTITLRNYNILIVDNDLDRKLLDINKPPPTTTSTMTAAAEESGEHDDYDYNGALIYIIFILCFYSLSVLLMILIQTQRSQFYYLDKSNGFDGSSARNVLKRIRSENIEREALGASFSFLRFVRDLRNFYFKIHENLERHFPRFIRIIEIGSAY